MHKEQACQKCSMPMDERTVCSCDPEKCIYCCEHPSQCTCKCTQKAEG